jgi:methylthioribulose 1-phosphate dehydratase/enolase-phosphatase E1
MAVQVDTDALEAVLLDIEGTVCPIDFVYDVLFPHVRDELDAFTRKDWGSEAMDRDLASFREQVLADQRAGVQGTVPIAEDSEGTEAIRISLVENALQQMSIDRKTTALKSIQGRLWRGGYEDGTLRSVVFDDVEGALQSWNARGVPVAIYSSGSIAAQKLFFRYTERGDMTPLLAGYFDTTTGPKREQKSYSDIAEALGTSPEAVLFATDIVAEAEAARAAGMVAVILDRPGNLPQPPHDFPRLVDLRGIAG